MTQRFWRIRLGATVDGNENVFNKCKGEKPSCIAVGWRKINLSKNLSEIKNDYEIAYHPDPFEGSERVQIKRWVDMKKGDGVVVMIVPATICVIGKIIRERYHKIDKGFIFTIIGPRPYTKENPYGDVGFYNRIDVEWITNPNKYIKTDSLPEKIRAKLNIPLTIIKLDSNSYNTIENTMNKT
jgi:hypothetical protein